MQWPRQWQVEVEVNLVLASAVPSSTRPRFSELGHPAVPLTVTCSYTRDGAPGRSCSRWQVLGAPCLGLTSDRPVGAAATATRAPCCEGPRCHTRASPTSPAESLASVPVVGKSSGRLQPEISLAKCAQNLKARSHARYGSWRCRQAQGPLHPPPDEPDPQVATFRGHRAASDGCSTRAYPSTSPFVLLEGLKHWEVWGAGNGARCSSVFREIH